MSGDELFSVKNSYYLGLYQQAMTEALSANCSTPDARVECDFIRFRACIAQGQGRLVSDEVGNGSPVALQAAKLLATYKTGGKEQTEMCLMQLKEWLADPEAMNNTQLLQVAAVVYSAEADWKEALKYTHQSTDLEVMYLVVHTYIAMHRLDLAKKHLAMMSQQDDDHTLTQLASAHIGINDGADKCQEAANTFNDLGEKYSMSTLLLNGMALANMQLGQHDEAERQLMDALSKNATDCDTLANLVVCMTHLGKPADQIARYTNQLRALSPSHVWVARYEELESSFDRCCAQFSDGVKAEIE